MATEKIIATVSLNTLFNEISKMLGFSEQEIKKYENNVFDLIDQWEEKGFVEIYTTDEDRDIGILKRSDIGKHAIPWYINLYHARITKNNDPILVFRRDEESSFSIRFLITHDKFFGSKKEKNNASFIKDLKMKIDELIQLGTKEEDKKKEKEKDKKEEK